MQTRPGIAPTDLIQEDFREFDSAVTLRTTWDIERLILIQSLQGHAHEGHGRFKGTKYPNTSIDDISRALRLDPKWVRSERQRLIDEIIEYVDKAIAGADTLPLSSDEGVGFLGSSMFHGISVPCKDVLRGLYIGGLRDETETRFAMEEEYGITIGGGKCYLVDTNVMDQMGLDGDILAHGAHEDMIEYYTDNGLIVGESGPDDGDLEYMYIRHRRGQGASDDTAIVSAGLLYNIGTAIGVFLSDAIDTIEKHVPVFSDQDEGIARRIKKEYKGLDVSDSELKYLTYLSAIPDESSIDVPDCSLRHMLEINRRHDVTAIESHMLFIEGKKYPKIRIGFEETKNHEYYSYVTERISRSRRLL